MGHDLQPLGRGWRCAACWRRAATRGLRGALVLAGCARPTALFGRLAAASVTHRIVDLEALDVAPLRLGVLRGRWSQRRAYGPAAPCRRRPLPAGLAASRKATLGRHPVSGCLRLALDPSCVDQALLPAVVAGKRDWQGPLPCLFACRRCWPCGSCCLARLLLRRRRLRRPLWASGFARRLRLSAWARPTAALRERERARACAA